MNLPYFSTTHQPSSSTSSVDYDNNLLHPFSNEDPYSSAGESHSPSASECSYDGTADVRWSTSAGSEFRGKGRKRAHVTQACDQCKKKKAACVGRTPTGTCELCRKSKEECTQKARDNRRSIKKEYVTSLEQVNAQHDKERKVWQTQERSLMKHIAALEERLQTAGVQELPKAMRQLTISIPVLKEQIRPSDGPGRELVGMGEVLVRDDGGSLSAYAGPSHLTHLSFSPSPDAFSPLASATSPFSPMSPQANANFTAYSNVIRADLQIQALQAFFAHSGTELLPLGPYLTAAVQRALTDPTTFSVSTPTTDPLTLTPALYYALMAVALPFAPPNTQYDPGLRSVFAHVGSLDLPGLFRAPSLANVLALGLLATHYAGVGEHDVGWQCAGMSARMMQSLGLHLDHASARKRDPAWALSHQERRFRNIVYWIVFVQDKFWSMWVGRAVTVADSNEIPLPEADDNSYPELIFQALCSLMRVANVVMPAVYGADRTSDKAEIDRCRLKLDKWFDDLSENLKPTSKAMNIAPTALRHLHLTFQWLKILLNRPFYRPTSDVLDQESGVHRCDTALKEVMVLLGPWLSHNASYIPLTPLGAQIVLSAGLTWLQSAVAYQQSSQKREGQGTSGAARCSKLLLLQGVTMPCARQFAGILRGLRRKYFTSVDNDGGHAAESPDIVIPQTSNIYQQQDYCTGPLFTSAMSQYPSQQFDNSVYGSVDPQPPRRSGSLGYTGPDTDIIADMSRFLNDLSPSEPTSFQQAWITGADGSQLAEEPFEMDMEGLSMGDNHHLNQYRPERDDTIMLHIPAY